MLTLAMFDVDFCYIGGWNGGHPISKVRCIVWNSSFQIHGCFPVVFFSSTIDVDFIEYSILYLLLMLGFSISMWFYRRVQQIFEADRLDRSLSGNPSRLNKKTVRHFPTWVGQHLQQPKTSKMNSWRQKQDTLYCYLLDCQNSILSSLVGETHVAWIRWNLGMAQFFSQRHVESCTNSADLAETSTMLEIPRCRQRTFSGWWFGSFFPLLGLSSSQLSYFSEV